MGEGLNRNQGACTIVSKNYFAYARTLALSYLRTNPGRRFFVCLVDENQGAIDFSGEPFEVIEAQELGIPGFRDIAFRFDILELNTNVKPSFLKYLFEHHGFDDLLYLDPDILVVSDLAEIYREFEQHDIVLTPHALSPVPMSRFRHERDFLLNGEFNLGFIGLHRTPNAIAFLTWWEERCVREGFREIESGLFVDQKWVNLAPCYFDRVHILKHEGCNVSYWNLHERRLSKVDGRYIVNDRQDLLFYHFSGIAVADPGCLSKYEETYDFKTRPDLVEIFDAYRSEIRSNGFDQYAHLTYAYGCFSNGIPITSLARRQFAAHPELAGTDPFEAEGRVYRWCLDRSLIPSRPMKAEPRQPREWRASRWIGFLDRILVCTLKLVGPYRYQFLMRYFANVSILRNQARFL